MATFFTTKYFVMPADLSLTVQTDRDAPFQFQPGIDFTEIDTLLLRVGDAQQRFASSPLAQVADQLEKEVVVSSIFGTNSIEGGTLTKEETQATLDLAPVDIEDIEQRRAINLKQAYELARETAAQKNSAIDEEYIRRLHQIITAKLPHEYNRPGLLRDNPKGIFTHVGDAAHGGRYKPPQSGKDLNLLLSALVQWHQQLKDAELPVLIRAPLMHYYFERIHPFWDGNGRVGRVVEATLLMSEGFRYAPFAMANYYHQHIDRYFALFNVCRKAAVAKKMAPNTPFVQFFLEGMLQTLNNLHDRVNLLVNLPLFERQVKHLFDEKKINARQYAIVNELLHSGGMSVREMRQLPWHLGLYAKLTDKTKQRDLKKLIEMQLIKKDKHDQLWPALFEPPK